MKKLALHKIIIVAATVALGSFSIATDALARGGGGGGGGHFGGGGGAHFGGGGGAHFGGGGGLAHFGGGGGLHMGGGQIGGAHFGGSHIGGSSVGAVHLGGASMARAPSNMASAHVSGRHVGAGLRTTGGRHHHRLGFARGLGYDAYGYDDDACWNRYSVRVHSHLNWRRRWICG
jgi:hypothetical protein